MNRAEDLVRKTAILKLIRDAADVIEAVGRLTDGEPRKSIGTLLYAAAALAHVEGMSHDDFFAGCETAWEAGQDVKTVMHKRKRNGETVGQS